MGFCNTRVMTSLKKSIKAAKMDIFESKNGGIFQPGMVFEREVITDDPNRFNGIGLQFNPGVPQTKQPKDGMVV